MLNYSEISNKTENMTLLYVEDDSVIRMSSLYLYEHIFDDVFVATNGQEGLELYLENRDSIDIVITDESMPGLNGTEMIREIRKVDKEVLIYLFTGYSINDISSKIEELSITGHFIKPVDFSEFIESLNKKL